MTVISRPFDKDKVENRELAALTHTKMESTHIDVFVVNILHQNDKKLMTIDELFAKEPHPVVRMSIPTVVMRLAHFRGNLC